jgi:uncharacterized membrane protein
VTNDREATRLAAERQIGRLLVTLTYLSVVLLLVGVGLMLGAGISPTAGGPDLDLATLGSQLVALDPDGFLWLGLLAVIAAPISRVVLAGYAYGRAGDWPMVAIAAAILAVIVVGVVTARTGSV